MRIFSDLDNAEWLFPDSGALLRKLNQRPWEEEFSEILTVTLSDRAWLSDFIESLRQKVFGITGGRSRLEFRFLEYFEPPDSREQRKFLAAVEEAFGLSGSRLADTSPRLARSILEEWKEESSPILVVIPIFSDSADWTLKQFSILIDDINKESANRRSGYDCGVSRTMFWLVVGDSQTNFGGQPTYDFTSGIPDCADMFGKAMGSAEMWQKYIMLRIAWETAGCPHLYELHATGKLPRDNDGEFEDWLNHQAKNAFAVMRDEIGVDFLAGIQELGPHVDNSDHRYDALIARHIFWRPPDEIRFQVAPWIARRLLSEDSNHPFRPQLCHALVCRPIAEKLMSLCLALEASIRLRVNSDPASLVALRHLKPSIDPDVAREATKKYYPDCHPALPLRDDEVWSLGDINKALPGDNFLLFRHANAIRTLRNYLAHNHYVSWRIIDEYRHLEKSWRAVL